MKKIEKRNIEDILSLTTMQEGILFEFLKDPQSDNYIEQLSLEISGEVDLKFFKKAWNFVIENNEMLRVVFRWEKTENPIQIILKEHKVQPEYYDFSNGEANKRKSRLEEIKAKDKKTKFSLKEVPLRLKLCKFQEDRYEMIISNHHILYDGWSNGIILKEFFKAYENLYSGKECVKPVKRKFKEFIKWIKNQASLSRTNYWKNYLEGVDTQTEISIKPKRKRRNATGKKSYQIRFEKDLKESLEDFVKKHRITPASLFYSVWGVLLQKYNSSEDVIFGTPVSGRSAKVQGIEEIVGLFINTLPLRIQSNANEKIADLLYRLDQSLQIREEYLYTPLVNIKKYCKIDSKEELFDTIVILENYPLDRKFALKNSKLFIESYSMVESTPYDLTVGIMTFDDIEINLTFDQDLFDEDTIVRMADHFRRITKNMIKDSEKLVADIEIISKEEKNRILYEFNHTDADYPKSKTIQQLFEEQVEKTPDHIALEYKGCDLTYTELNRRVNQLARFLRKKGITSDSICGIMIKRSIHQFIAIFAVLKAGSAFLPLDPKYPEERLAFMIKDTNLDFILTVKAALNVSPFGRLIIDLDTDGYSITCESNTNLNLNINHHIGDKPAYIIYTSGSTGTPKGVIGLHKGIINRCYWMWRTFPFKPDDICCQKTSMNFVDSIWEIFGPLLVGVPVIIIPDETVIDLPKLVQILKIKQVTRIVLVPGLLYRLFDNVDEHFKQLSRLKFWVTSGEALSPNFPQVFKESISGGVLLNLYGSSEVSADVTWYQTTNQDTEMQEPTYVSGVPIGRPIDNTRIYILDKHMYPVPIGIMGEIYAGGVGLSSGYINRPEPTAAAFVSNPFNGPGKYKKEVFFRTGDLGRYLPNGTIEYLGRRDHQVKVRGCRIELGEIENHLQCHPAVKEAAVIVKNDKEGEKDLYAFVILEKGKEITVTEIRQYMLKTLPDYMLPSHFVPLEEIPRTPGGKLHRKALEKMEIKGSITRGVQYTPPTSELQTKIQQIWIKLLGIDIDKEQIGINDNFFDLGGHSLLLIKLKSKLERTFGGEIGIIELFNYPTIAYQARLIEQQMKVGAKGKIKVNSNESKEKDARKMLEKDSSPLAKGFRDIAVIGISLRTPGANGIDEFWKNLIHGTESISFFKEEELQGSEAYQVIQNHLQLIPAGGVLGDIEWFDADFFGINPKEAEIMDPQQRLFLEHAWKALEDAGYVGETYPGAIGVYAGVGWNIYLLNNVLANPGIVQSRGEFQTMIANDKDFLATRVSYKLNLKGPALTVQTACSTSLAAVHLAKQGLLNGECDMALAGGVAVKAPEKTGYIYTEGSHLSPDGHCRPFDAQAQGTVFGNGIGIVVLKRLQEAVNDNDHIYAVIKGSALNNDGSLKVGYTSPGEIGQSEVILKALKESGVPPHTIGYVETHGTGTVLGDPVEITALTRAFYSAAEKTGTQIERKQFCAIGSVKANVGHLDVAAGIIGLIKTVLCLKYKQIPPIINFTQSNPLIDFTNSPFYVNHTLEDWPESAGKPGTPGRAAVSALGIGGTNVHVILEEAPRAQSAKRRAHSVKHIEHGPLSQGRGGVSPPGQSRDYQLILLSAKTKTALDKMTQNLLEYFKNTLLNHGNHENPINPGLTLADTAYTLQVGRKFFNHRRILVCSDVNESIESISGNNPEIVQANLLDEGKGDSNVVFMFSGQGSQYVNMGLELYQTETLFREEMDRCFEILKPIMGYDIKEILYPRSYCRGGSPCPPQDCVGSPGQGDHSARPPGIGDSPLERGTPDPRKGEGVLDINQTEIAQPLLFAFEYALAKLLLKWGIKPYAMIGHSIGEYVAACLAGVFSLADALSLVVSRGQLMQQMPHGSMLGVPLPEKELTPLLNNEIALAAVNSTADCVLSGTFAAIDKIEKQLKEKGIKTSRLHTSHAFHSMMMDPILNRFEQKVKSIQRNKPQMPYLSNLTGNWISLEQATDPGYWSKHIRQTIRFADGINVLSNEKNTIFIEVGPGRALGTLVKKSRQNQENQMVVNLVRHPREKVSDIYFMVNKIGVLWLWGLKPDWNRFHAGEQRHRLSLPTYPFEGRRYWIKENKQKRAWPGKDGELTAHPSKIKEISNWFYVPSWKRSDRKSNPSIMLEGACSWLVFVDNCNFSLKLIQQLVQSGHDVITVKPGSVFTRESDRSYVINPGEPGDYDALIRSLSASNEFPGRIIHAWNINENDENDTGEPGIEGIKKTQDLGFFSLIFLARAIGKRDFDQKFQVAVLTESMYDVMGEEQGHPGKATLLGPIKVIPQEYPHIRCRSIDIRLPKPGSWQEKQVFNALLTELINGDVHNEPVVVYRGNRRWVQTFEHIFLDKDEKSSLRLKKQGVYLITGGLGNIGLTAAEYLAKTWQAKLILTTHSCLPPREKWDTWLDTHAKHDQISRKIRKVKKMEGLGSEVIVAHADVTHLQEMERVFMEVEKQFGKPDGIIHAAGIAIEESTKSIQEITREKCFQVFQPKISGLLVLEKILKGKQLDFCLVFSSLSSILGGVGFAAYSAANIFMDEFVQRQNASTPLHWISVNWDLWKFAEQNNKTAGPGANLLELAIEPGEGIEAINHILNQEDANQVIVSTGELSARIKQWIYFESSRDNNNLEKRDSPVNLNSRPALPTQFVAPGNNLEKMIANIWEDYFGIKGIGIYDNFFDLGATSLDLIRLNDKLKKILKKELSTKKLFTYTTIHALAGYLRHMESGTGIDDEEMDRTNAVIKGKNRQKRKKMSLREDSHD